MTSEQRGVAKVTVNNEDSRFHGKTFTLQMSMNAAVKVEQTTKKRIGQLYQEAAALGFESIRIVVWALLQKHHAQEFKAVESAGELIDDVGGIGIFFQALMRLSDEQNAEPVHG